MMSDQDILERAIKKAIKGGWRLDWTGKNAFRVWHLDTPDLVGDDRILKFSHRDYRLTAPREFIFNHDFAKALWGEHEYVVKERTAENGLPLPPRWDEKYLGWQYHLQQMVIADDPIQYLRSHLE